MNHLFPIQGQYDRDSRKHLLGTKIPWEIIAPHEKQAMLNHGGQSLVRLAERGGLGYDEAVAVLQDRDWTRMSVIEAANQLTTMIDEWKAANPGVGRGWPYGDSKLTP